MSISRWRERKARFDDDKNDIVDIPENYDTREFSSF